MGHVSYSEIIQTTPAQIWKILTDVTRLPEWAYKDGRFPYPVEGKYGSDQTEGTGTLWVGLAADGQTATQKITTWEAPQKLAYELQETANAPLQMAQHNSFTLEPDGENTKVTWDVHWELTGGFSLRALLVRFTAAGAFEEMMAGSLQQLKQLVEQEAAEAEAPPADTTGAQEEAAPPPAESPAETPPTAEEDNNADSAAETKNESDA